MNVETSADIGALARPLEMAEARQSLPHAAEHASRRPATQLEGSDGASRHADTNSAFEPLPQWGSRLLARWQFEYASDPGE
jgi:hypothetical protein